MPGILYHLTFAEELYKRINSIIPTDKVAFMAGNLIPDLVTDKKNSHFRKNASVEGFFVPEMSTVKGTLFCISDPIRLGMYAHLYLDYYFIEHFLIPEFIWNKEEMKVINPRNNKEWDVQTFFSNEGLYGSYTEINQLLLRDGHVSIDTINAIPEVLPDTGMPVFDTRREKTWKAELAEYLNEKKDYTGDVFDYERLTAFIKEIAKKFMEDIYYHLDY